jgi:hypothetical protein
MQDATRYQGYSFKSLREYLETAHKVIKENTEKETLCQKNHDAKVAWSNFKPGENVYVYFPIRKSGCTPKITSFWRGPSVIEKMLQVFLNAVACRFWGQDQRYSL